MKHIIITAAVLAASASQAAYAQQPELAEGEGYARIHLLEEVTSTGCAFCPRGIATLAYVNEKYPDKFITVAYHTNMQGTKDPMYCESAQPFIREFNTRGTIPFGIIDRNLPSGIGEYNDMVGVREYIDGLCASMADERAIAGIELTAALTDEDNPVEAMAEATVTFALDMPDSDQYRLEFVLVEDGVGPYRQDNRGYSMTSADCGGWEVLGRTPNVEHEHVARELVGFLGIEGSVAADMKKGEGHSFKQAISLSMVERDTEFVRIVAVLTDTRTKEVVNAQAYDLKIREPQEVPDPDDPNNSGVEGIEADSADAPAAWYTLQGVRVDRPVSGSVCIRVAGNTAEKVFVR